MKSLYLLDGRNVIISKLGKDDYYVTDSTYGFVGEINHGEMIEWSGKPSNAHLYIFRLLEKGCYDNIEEMTEEINEFLSYVGG